ncbi:MAG TPA: DUF1016 N-terminal domain-containing protein [Terriglobales bacterium]|nr:DUF1016 N-terminal domain-containing protein [Terriglobales bacterium]
MDKLTTRTLQFPDGYDEFLRQLKQRIQQAQIKAAPAVNRELVLLYWQIGRDILERQSLAGWGSKIIDRLAKDLHREFPEHKGFSPRNLNYMRAFAAAWTDKAIVQQLVARIPWGHNVRLLDMVKTSDERLWYVDQAVQQRLEPEHPRRADRDRPIPAAGEGANQFRCYASGAGLRLGPAAS